LAQPRVVVRYSAVVSAVRTGLARLLAGDDEAVRGRPLGLVANPTAVDDGLRHIVDLLVDHPATDLRVLFGPEHGLRGDAQDMIAVDAAVDPRSGLPVYSLYGATDESLSPRPEQLQGLGALVFDIQDVGARYYTYVWTLVHCMRACAAAGVRVVVLDRPNPIGGIDVEGGAVADASRSFVGLCSLPNRHGLTVGEIARWANEDQAIGADLHVIAMEGWTRAMHYPQTGLPWVLPSPNMPTYDTALVYPGMCLIEATELSEGRGTTRPFEIIGAPFVDGYRLAEELRDLPGLVCRPLHFTPTFQKHAGVLCGGIQLHVTDRAQFRPYLTGVAVLRAVHLLWPEQFQWRTRAYEFVADRPAIDLLSGSEALRLAIERGASLSELSDGWKDDEQRLRGQLQAWWLYR
jgi:uncharacterized protein YbbC (DUF1343 family)